MKLTTETIVLRDGVEIAGKSEDMQHGGIRPDRDAHPALLDIAQRRDGHPRALRDEFCGKSTAKPSHANPLAKACKAPLHRRKQWRHTP